MTFEAKVLADSIAPNGKRLVTVEATFPRIILAEANTHCALARNSASSRAIPVEKMIQRVEDNPFIPVYWGKNQPGMQAQQELDTQERANAITYWLQAAKSAVEHARTLQKLGVHKQITNRLLEPFLWHTAIISATEWSNFFALRCHPDAQPEFRTIATMMREAMDESTPQELGYTDWHLPLTPDFDELIQTYHIDDIKKISVGRCARVSYLTHHGERDPKSDIELCDRLATNGHLSPFEHVAHPLMPVTDTYLNTAGKFKGWQQYRKYIPHESDFSQRTT